jgi:hypothetical protein
VAYGPCRKQFICFPPSKRNDELRAQNIGRTPQLSNYGEELEGGLIIDIGNHPESDGNCLIMHPGTGHAVTTITGGFLGGINFSTVEMLESMADSMILQLNQPVFVDGDFDEDMAWFINTVKRVLEEQESTHMITAVRSFLRIRFALSNVTKAMKKKLRSLQTLETGERDILKIWGPTRHCCGESVNGKISAIKQHFAKNH